MCHCLAKRNQKVWRNISIILIADASLKVTRGEKIPYLGKFDHMLLLLFSFRNFCQSIKNYPSSFSFSAFDLLALKSGVDLDNDISGNFTPILRTLLGIALSLDDVVVGVVAGNGLGLALEPRLGGGSGV